MEKQNQQKTQLGQNAQIYEGPDIFCWTKIGSEAGQSLGKILKRKEFERRAGDGLFAWGIGNSLGKAVEQARRCCSPKAIRVLFTPMKSAAKPADSSPRTLLLWTSYITRSGYVAELPEHILITSRDNLGNKSKKYHYALLCHSDTEIVEGREGVSINASWARNFSTLNKVGYSQVTSLVKYDKNFGEQMNEYSVAFSASLAHEGFIKLCNPIELTSDILISYEKIERQESHEKWLNLVKQLKRVARKKTKNHPYQAPLCVVGD